MEITTKMKDDLVQWMAVQEQAMMNYDYNTGTEEFPITVHCLGYIAGVNALHMFDIRPIMMILGIPEEDAKLFVYDEKEGLEYRYRYSIKIGAVEYYSMHKQPWGEEV